MKLTTTVCLALAVVLCYLVTAEASPIQKDDVAGSKTEVAGRQSGPIVSPAVPGEADDDDDGRLDQISDSVGLKFHGWTFA